MVTGAPKEKPEPPKVLVLVPVLVVDDGCGWEKPLKLKVLLWLLFWLFVDWFSSWLDVIGCWCDYNDVTRVVFCCWFLLVVSLCEPQIINSDCVTRSDDSGVRVYFNNLSSAIFLYLHKTVGVVDFERRKKKFVSCIGL